MPRGGNRKGAGRPPGPDKVAITVRLSIDNADWLKSQSNQSRTIDGLISKEREQDNN